LTLIILSHLVDEETRKANDFNALFKMAPDYGVYVNSHTFEVDLFRSGLHPVFAQAMAELRKSSKASDRMTGWAGDLSTLDIEILLKDIESVGKGRFAQRVASIIVGADLTECPKYIIEGVAYVASKCQHS